MNYLRAGAVLLGACILLSTRSIGQEPRAQDGPRYFAKFVCRLIPEDERESVESCFRFHPCLRGGEKIDLASMLQEIVAWTQSQEYSERRFIHLNQLPTSRPGVIEEKKPKKGTRASMEMNLVEKLTESTKIFHDRDAPPDKRVIAGSWLVCLAFEAHNPANIIPSFVEPNNEKRVFWLRLFELVAKQLSECSEEKLMDIRRNDVNRRWRNKSRDYDLSPLAWVRESRQLSFETVYPKDRPTLDSDGVQKDGFRETITEFETLAEKRITIGANRVAILLSKLSRPSSNMQSDEAPEALKKLFEEEGELKKQRQ